MPHCGVLEEALAAMKPWCCHSFFGAALLCILATPVRAAERSEIPTQYTWNLADLYADEAAWMAAKTKLASRIPELGRYRGHLGDSAAKLHEALAAIMEAGQELAKLAPYASMLSDQDSRVGRPLEMRQEAEQLGVQFSTAVAFVTPEILALGEKKVRGFVEAEPKLRDYAQYLDDILRRGPHTLGAAEETIVAQAGNLTDAGQAMHGIFTNADFPYPEIVLASGEKVVLDAAAYTRYRALPDRAERDKIFRAFWSAYSKFTRTLGVSLYAQVKAHMFERDVRKFDSCVEAALFDFNIPISVYSQLIADVHTNLPTLHRYLGLRRRIMGVEQLRYEDLYASIVDKVDLTYTPEQGVELTLAACKPLGDDYVATMKKGFDSRWVDFLPNTGKRSGAYSQGIYGVHPYQLVNYMGRYEDVSVLAHEYGHSMHSYLADQAQPYPTHDYPIFVAEVASTLSENLLLHDMLGRTKDDPTRLFLLGSYLDNMRQTLFRQTLFAEFEMRIHEMAEHGESLTGDNMTALYLGLLKEYYGDAKGVCKIDDLYGVEWAYIPHFYYNFYVYQYATSLVASSSIANRIRDDAAAGKTQARDSYVRMLSAGGSKYAIDLLKDAGVDMTTSEPFKAAMRQMNLVMDEIEKILDRTGTKKSGS